MRSSWVLRRKERRMGRNPLLIRLWGQSVMSSPSWFWYRAPAENGFIVIYSPQIASFDSR